MKHALHALWIAGTVVAVTARAERVDFSAQWDTARVLENPHKGWYHHYYDNGTAKYGIASDAELDTFPGMDHLYLRLAWSYFESAGDDRYDWSLIDDAVARWVPKGYRISIRITSKETGDHSWSVGQKVDGINYATPKWVRDNGCDGVVVDNWGLKHWEPVWDDPHYLAALEDFTGDFAARYDGKPWLAYVDIGSIGDWGEGHTGFSSDITPTAAVCKTHMDIFAAAFSRTPVVVVDAYVAWRKSDAEKKELFDHAWGLGFTLRDDSPLVDYYMDEHAATFSVVQRDLFEKTYRERPTILETQHYHMVKDDGHWIGANGEDILPEYGMSGADFLRGAVEAMHATWIGYHGYAGTWLKENPDLARSLANRAGYWYFIKSVQLPDRVIPGTEAVVSIEWTNRGVAPAYHQYALEVLFCGKSTKTVSIADSRNREWMDGETETEEYRIPVPPGMKAGSCIVKLKMVDRADTRREIELGMSEHFTDENGYGTLGTVTIGSVTPVHHPRAGAVSGTAKHHAVRYSPAGRCLDRVVRPANGVHIILHTDKNRVIRENSLCAPIPPDPE